MSFTVHLDYGEGVLSISGVHAITNKGGWVAVGILDGTDLTHRKWPVEAIRHLDVIWEGP